MTDNTANYQWPMAESTDYATAGSMNQTLDAVDTEFKTVMDSLGGFTRPIIVAKLRRKFTVSNTMVHYLYENNPNDPFWEEVFKVDGPVGGVNLNPVGYFSVETEGVYKLTYCISIVGSTSPTEAWYSAGLYTVGNTLVSRTFMRQRMQNMTTLYGTHSIQLVTYLRAKNDGTGDIYPVDGHKIGLRNDTSSGTIFITTNLDPTLPYVSRVQLEYVRAL